jgi:hypothetical protein
MPSIILADCKEVLTPYRRQKERYHCPACDGHNLTFSDIGQWMCWNNPTREHRVEILNRLFPNRERSNHVPKREPEYPQEIAPRVHPSQLGYPLLTDEVLCQSSGNHTIYRYSDTQRVVRIDTAHKRYIFPQYLDGEWFKGAGKQPWQTYGVSRLLPRPGVTNLILIVEGQKCVEIAHSRGIPALCLEAGDYSSQTAFDKLRAIKVKFGRQLLLVVLPDHDTAGINKANVILHTARYFNLPTMLLDPLVVERQLIKGGDIEQMPNLNRDRLMQIAKQKLTS